MIGSNVREAMRRRPDETRVMTQTWSNLSFLHFPMDPEVVQSKLPPGLTVDTFPDERGEPMAWIGLVPFEIRELSFARELRFPTASTFCETNVRTYVHREGREPGVWFFSLDAASFLACTAARVWFGLPYWHAAMSIREETERYLYHCQRKRGGRPMSTVEVVVGEFFPTPQPDDFEFFLIERYLLYSFYRGKLWTGRVFHQPYSLRRLELRNLDDHLVSASGLPLSPVSSALFSPGVAVEIYPLRPVE